MVCTSILPPYDAQSHPSQRMRVQHSQFLISYLDLPAIIRKHVTFSTTQESGESSRKQTICRIEEAVLTSYLCRCLSSTYFALPYLKMEITNYIDFLALEMSPKSCVLCTYNLADLQSGTWKWVLLEPKRIVPPIWVVDPFYKKRLKTRLRRHLEKFKACNQPNEKIIW